MGDVARLRFAEDYDAVARPGTETVNGKPTRVLDLTAKSPKAEYPKVTLWYDPAAKLPAKVVFILPSGRPAKEVVFSKFATSRGKTIVSEMEIRDLLAGDRSTVTRLQYLDYRPAKLDGQDLHAGGGAGVQLGPSPPRCAGSPIPNPRAARSAPARRAATLPSAGPG